MFLLARALLFSGEYATIATREAAMQKILVSACLYGNKCRYKGDDCFNAKVAELGKHHIIIPVCA